MAPEVERNSSPFETIRLDINDGVGILTLCSDEGRPFILRELALRELESVLSGPAQGKIRGLVLESEHPSTFCAGADIDSFSKVTDPDEAREVSRRGQELFTTISNLPYPTVAAIHGVCVGGGFELALACDARIVSDDRATRLGLPEVQLGILPAWGGTTRLPALVGLRHALSFLLTGRTLNAWKAVTLGVASDRVPPQIIHQRCLKEIDRLGAGTVKGRRRSFLDSCLENIGFLRNRLLGTARKRVMAESKGHYPAPLAIIDVLRDGAGMDMAGRLELERNALADLIRGNVCRNLVSIFTRNRDRSRGAPYDVKILDEQEIERVTVAGGGVMGAGIAAALLLKGRTVRVVDPFPEALGKARKTIDRELESRVKKRRMDRSERKQVLSRLELSTDYRGIRASQLIIEAVPEVPEIKEKVFGEIARYVSPDAIITSNTSGLSVSELARHVNDQSRFAGLHFFNPAPKMPLVEIVRSEGVSEETLVQLVRFSRKIGKVPVITADTPCFVVNRILGPYLLESVKLLQSGASIEKVDRSIREFGLPMGPFELMDTVGLDVVAHVAENMAGVPGVSMERQPIIGDLVQKGQIGRKSGVGFYSWNGKKKTPCAFEGLPAGEKPHEATADARNWNGKKIREHLLSLLRQEGQRVLDDQVVQTVDDLDLASIFGMGFPPYTGGIGSWLKSQDEN